MIPSTSVTYILTRLTTEQTYFINNIIPQYNLVVLSNFGIESELLTVGDILDSPAFLLIQYSRTEALGGEIVKDFSIVEDEPVSITVSSYPDAPTETLNVISYSQKERENLTNLYGFVEPTLQIDLDSSAEMPENQQSIESTELSYNSLSPLGDATAEAFSVSTVAEGESGLIITPEEVVSDVGGLSGAGRDREITNRDVSTEIQNEALSTTGVSTETVTTSGY